MKGALVDLMIFLVIYAMILICTSFVGFETAVLICFALIINNYITGGR